MSRNLVTPAEIAEDAARMVVDPEPRATVVRYCGICRQVRTKSGPHASDPKFRCEECSQ